MSGPCKMKEVKMKEKCEWWTTLLDSPHMPSHQNEGSENEGSLQHMDHSTGLTPYALPSKWRKWKWRKSPTYGPLYWTHPIYPPIKVLDNFQLDSFIEVIQPHITLIELKRFPLSPIHSKWRKSLWRKSQSDGPLYWPHPIYPPIKVLDNSRPNQPLSPSHQKLREFYCWESE